MDPKDNFYNFLQVNGVYEGFCRAVREQRGRSFEEACNSRDVRDDLYDIINSAFTWSATKEKEYLWRDLCGKWNRAIAAGETFLTCKSIW